MSKVGIFYISILLLSFLFLTCTDNKTTPTEPIKTAEVYGQIYQESNGLISSLEGVEVFIGSYSTLSDSIGMYSIEVPIGNYDIICVQNSTDTTFVGNFDINQRRVKSIELSGETYTLSGIVSDTLGQIISGAVVELEHLKDTTDVDGQYYFYDIPPGEWNLSIHYLDYANYGDTVKIENSNIEQNLSLIRKSFQISGTVSHSIDGLLVGIEVILDDTLYDTTNANGEYMFENIYSGEHEIKVVSPVYSYDLQIIILNNSDYQLDMSLNRIKNNIFGSVFHSIDGLLVGLEVILDDTLYDTTNVNGEYMFENIYSGEHQIRTNSSAYIYEIYNFTLGYSDLQKDLIVGKSSVQKIMIEKDAYVESYCSYSDNLGYTVCSGEDKNFGNSSMLDVSYDHLSDWGHTGVGLVWNYTYRSYFNLPEITINQYDSLILVFTSLQYVTPEIVFFGNLDSSWDEMTITWNNQPQVTSNFLSINPIIDDSLKWKINITDKIENFTDSLGVRIYFGSESCYFMCSSFLPLFSSDSPELEKRPYILIYRTE